MSPRETCRCLAAVTLALALPLGDAAAQDPLPIGAPVQDALAADPVTSEDPQVEDTLSEEVPSAEAAPVSVTVVGRSGTASVRRSAYSVTVVDTQEAKQQSADLGDVLARETPVTVQRTGGLGSQGTYALGGLGGERLRFFIDAIPLELMGFLTGPGNVPVNLVDRVEVYQGMVPLNLAGDALGGAVNLVTDQRADQSGAAASYQIGSFGTHRATLAARYAHRPSGLFVRASGFFDTADNDYEVDVETWDAQGRLQPTTVPLFHNGYRAMGGHVAVGAAQRSWADLLVLQAFLSDYENEVQNGLSMSKPYGEVLFAQGTWGTNFKYVQRIGARLQLDAIGGFARTTSRFSDLSNCLYDWHGTCTPRSMATLRGEIAARPVDRELNADTFFFKPEVTAKIHEDHELRVVLAPTYTDRRGKNLTRSQDYDPLAQPRRLFTGVAGVELKSQLLVVLPVTNILSLKGYMLATDSQELLATGQWRDMSRTTFDGGVGDSLRIELSPTFSAKVSYEYAMRLPTADELYGDGDVVLENLSLRPERSHNVNLGLSAAHDSVLGVFSASVEGFARFSEDFIAQLGAEDFVTNVNIWDARVIGVEARAGWMVPKGEWLAVDGRVTYQDLRNRSTEGELAPQSGDRIPNVPYLLANAGVDLRGTELLLRKNTVELGYSARYVHDFLRGWESLARKADRLTIDAQLTHNLSFLHAIEIGGVASTATFEVHNLTNARVFDFYGLQRPGRSFHTKITLQL